jgi:hypothetical protein
MRRKKFKLPTVAELRAAGELPPRPRAKSEKLTARQKQFRNRLSGKEIK